MAAHTGGGGLLGLFFQRQISPGVRRKKPLPVMEGMAIFAGDASHIFPTCQGLRWFVENLYFQRIGCGGEEQKEN
jgi:hypothetical protein